MPARLVTLDVGTELMSLDRLGMPLLQRAMLRRILTLTPNLEVLDPNGSGLLTRVKHFPWYRIANRLMWAGWKLLPGTGQSQMPAIATCWLADRLVSRYVPQSGIFHGLAGNCLASLRAAKRQRAFTIVQIPSLHPWHWQREVMTECAHFGVNWRKCPSVMPKSLIRRMQREFEQCDRIVVLSSVARRSFEQFSYADKVSVVLPGVDQLFFSPPAQPRPSRLFRACYVGRVQIAKGVGYLLQAWRRLNLPRAELVLVGQVYPEMHSVIATHADASVKLVGELSPEEVAKLYRESDLFVFPSVNEGFGLVLLEAMASGLPVVATDRSGAADCVTEGKEGFVAASRNVDALAEAILWCYRHPDETAALGKAARAKVVQQFTLSHYVERQIALYRTLDA